MESQKGGRGSFLLVFPIVLLKEVFSPALELFATYPFFPHAFFSSFLKVSSCQGRTLTVEWLYFPQSCICLPVEKKEMPIRERGSVTAKFLSNQAAERENPVVGAMAEIKWARVAGNTAAESCALLKSDKVKCKEEIVCLI